MSHSATGKVLHLNEDESYPLRIAHAQKSITISRESKTEIDQNICSFIDTMPQIHQAYYIQVIAIDDKLQRIKYEVQIFLAMTIDETIHPKLWGLCEVADTKADKKATCSFEEDYILLCRDGKFNKDYENDEVLMKELGMTKPYHTTNEYSGVAASIIDVNLATE